MSTSSKVRGRRASNTPPLTHRESAATDVWAVDGWHLHADDDWRVWADSSLDRWEVYVDVEHERTFVHQDTWNTIAWDPRAQTTFIKTYVHSEGVSGMRFIVADAFPWADAVRKEALAAGKAAPEPKDRLTQLSEKASGLILQAASLNQSATADQAATFGVRYARLAEELAVLEQELARARGLVELAATAVVDSSG